jgi:hypothetical protein
VRRRTAAITNAAAANTTNARIGDWLTLVTWPGT